MQRKSLDPIFQTSMHYLIWDPDGKVLGEVYVTNRDNIVTGEQHGLICERRKQKEGQKVWGDISRSFRTGG